MARPAPRALSAVLAGLALAACTPTTIEERACPPGGTTLTYASFGEAFLATHCQTCHGATSGRREGAPSSYDFGSLEEVRRVRDRIFVRAAADNVTMPPGPDDPSPADREKLAEWLACGAP